MESFCILSAPSDSACDLDRSCRLEEQNEEVEMPWRERFQDYMRKEQADLKRRIHELASRKCEMWETTDGDRKDVTEDYAAHLRSRLAEMEQMIVEENLS